MVGSLEGAQPVTDDFVTDQEYIISPAAGEFDFTVVAVTVSPAQMVGSSMLISKRGKGLTKMLSVYSEIPHE